MTESTHPLISTAIVTGARHWVCLSLPLPLNLCLPLPLVYRSVVLTSVANCILDSLAAKENIPIVGELEYRTVLFGVGCCRALIQNIWRNNSAEQLMPPKDRLNMILLHRWCFGPCFFFGKPWGTIYPVSTQSYPMVL